MRILKDIDRQTFKERFTTKEDCYNLLAELKCSEGYSCTRCDSHVFIKESNQQVVDVVNVDMMNLPQQGPYFIN